MNYEKELEQEIHFLEANLWANEGWVRQPQAPVVDQAIAEPTPMILVWGKMVLLSLSLECTQEKEHSTSSIGDSLEYLQVKTAMNVSRLAT